MTLAGLGPVYTMDHELGPWKLAFSHGLIFMVQSPNVTIYKVFGPSHFEKIDV
jgi:hypothetical protein